MTKALSILRNSDSFGEFTAVTIGSFDGYHKGHHYLLTRLHEEAQKRGLLPVAITFEPHPRLFFNHSMPLLSTLKEKIWLFETYSPVSTLLIQTFDHHFANMSPETFIEAFLMQQVKARLILIGFNHRFGKHRQGDIALLQSYADKGAFELHVVPPVKGNEDQLISSSVIRNLLSTDRFQEAVSLLGHPYVLIGRVIHGEGIGRRLGFPTANLQFDHPQKLVPRDGVYVATVCWQDQFLPAAVSIGTRPTFHDTKSHVEVYILNFQGDLYGKELVVLLHAKIRDQIQFESKEALIRQMEKDVAVVAHYFLYDSHSDS